MTDKSPQTIRLAILGNSGSGKSSLARALGVATEVPVLDLDTIAWEPQSEPVLRPTHIAAKLVREFCEQSDGWIIEGCYADLILVAQEFSARLLFLNPGLEACIANCKARPWEPHKFSTPEKQNEQLQFLLSWVAEYDTREGNLSLQGHRQCFASYTGPKRELTSVPSLSPIDPELLAWLG